MHDAVYDAVYNAFHMDQAAFNALYAEAIARESDAVQTETKNVSDQGEKYLNQNATDQEIIKKVRDAKLTDADADLETILDESELKRYNEIMGDTEPTVANLNSKLTELETNARSCASGVQELVGALNNGTVDGGYVDAEGKVHATVSTVGERVNVYKGDTEAFEHWQNEGYVTESEDADGTIHMKKIIVDEVEVPEGTEGIKTGNETVDSAAEGEDIDWQRYLEDVESYANAVNMAKDDFKDYIEVIKEAGGDSRSLKEMSDEERRSLLELAKTAVDVSNAWNSLTSSQKDNISMIKNGEKANVNYASGLKSVMQNVKTIFGNSKAVTADFVEENIDLIEDMSNGVEGAAEKVEEKVLRAEAALDGWDYDKKIQVDFDVDGDGLKDQLSTIGEVLNNFGDQHANEPVGFVATIDNTPAIAGLNELLSAGEMTAEEMTAALATIGWEPEIEY